jgi:hypothetical protein
MTRHGRNGASKMDRVDGPQVQREYANFMALLALIAEAEDRGLAQAVDFAAAAALQGTMERLRRAAVREYQLMTWGREVGFIHA